MLVMGGDKDHTVPHSVTHAAFKIDSKNEGVTEFAELEGRGHSLIIDNGLRDVCGKALAFVKRFV